MAKSANVRGKIWALLAARGERDRAVNHAKRLGRELGRIIYSDPGAGEDSYIHLLNMQEVCWARIWSNRLAKRTANSKLWNRCSLHNMSFGFLLGCEFYFFYYPLVQYALLLEAMKKVSLAGELLVSARIPLPLRMLLPLWARRQGVHLFWLGRRKERNAFLAGGEMVKALLLRPLYDWFGGLVRRIFLKRPSSPGEVLLVAQYSRADVESLLPVYRYLLENQRGWSVRMAAVSQSAQKFLRAQGVRSPLLDDAIRLEDILTLFARTLKYLSAFKSTIRRVWLEMGFPADVAPALERCAPFSSSGGFIISLIRLVTVYRHYLSEAKPRLLLLADDVHPRGRVLAGLARGLSIPSVNLQNGITGGEYEDYGFIPLAADYFAAWGEVSRSWMVAKGTAPDRVPVCGSPRFESIMKLYRDIAPAKEAKMDTVLLLTSPFAPAEVAKIVQMVGEVIASRPDLTLLVKPHPSEDVRLHRSILSSLADLNGRFRILPQNCSLHQALADSHIVLTSNSGAGIEALLAGRFLVSLNLTIWPEMIPYVKAGVALPAHNREELALALKKITAYPQVRNGLLRSRQAFYRQYLNGLSGGAGDDILALCRKLYSVKS
jgi:hypothetical protein